MIRDKIKEIADNKNLFEIIYYNDEGSYKEYKFRYKKILLRIVIYSFLFRDKVELFILQTCEDYRDEITLQKQEERLLAKAFLEIRKNWKKENKNISYFSCGKFKRENELLNSINFN